MSTVGRGAAAPLSPADGAWLRAPTIGLDLGGTKCLGVLLSADGDVVAERRAPTPLGTDAVAAAVTAVGAELLEIDPDAAAVGLGAPGLVDREGVLRFAPNLPGVVDVDLGAALTAALGRPAIVDNDVTCAVWAEHDLGAGRGHVDLVLAALGTGIGGGLVSDGRLLRGAHGFAGEIGHMVVDPDGVPCTCGQRGCWERYASGSALGRMGREAAAAGAAARVLELAGGVVDAVEGEHVGAAAGEGDAAARAILEEVGHWVGRGLADLAALLDPEVFVIGGGLVELGELLLAPARQSLAEHLPGGARRPPVAVVPAALGERAGAIGAARLARRRIVEHAQD